MTARIARSAHQVPCAVEEEDVLLIQPVAGKSKLMAMREYDVCSVYECGRLVPREFGDGAIKPVCQDIVIVGASSGTATALRDLPVWDLETVVKRRQTSSMMIVSLVLREGSDSH